MGIYIALLAALRIFGKREVGQFTLYDLVLVLLVANAVQPAMTGPDSSLLGGLIIIGALIAINLVVSRLNRLGLLHRFFTAQPTLVAKNGQYLDSGMRREGVDREEVDMAIREHGFESVNDIALAVLEPDGSISVVGKGDVRHSRRRVRRRYRPGR